MNLNSFLLIAFLLQFIIITQAQYFCTSYYQIKSGDTCYQLALSRGCPLESFLQLNPGINCNNLQIGQIVCLSSGVVIYPVNPTTAFPISYGTCYSYYTIKAGDLCYDIANRYGIQLYFLYTYNPGINCENLQIGQQICLYRQ